MKNKNAALRHNTSMWITISRICQLQEEYAEMNHFILFSLRLIQEK